MRRCWLPVALRRLLSLLQLWYAKTDQAEKLLCCVANSGTSGMWMTAWRRVRDDAQQGSPKTRGVPYVEHGNCVYEGRGM